MQQDTPNINNVPPKKWLLIGLLSAVFAVNVIDVFVRLLLPEIAVTYGITTGVAARLTAFSAIAGIVTALVLSALSIRIRFKILLLSGVLCAMICVIGVYLAPNFLTAQLFYAFNGVGSVIVSVMAPVLIAELYPLEKKAVRISWILATGQLALIIGNPITGFIANAGIVTSWKNALILFMLPATALCFALAAYLVPSKSIMQQYIKKPPFMSGYKEILKNKSALALLVSACLMGAFAAISTFGTAYLADVFQLNTFSRSVVQIIAAVLLIAGMIAGGLLVNIVGRKRLLVAPAIPITAITIAAAGLMIYIPNLWVILTLRFAVSFMGALSLVAAPNMSLETVPKFRGTMMSLSSTLTGLGIATGAILGGRLLDSINKPVVGYPTVMMILGTLGLIGTLIVTFLSKDPITEYPALKQAETPW